MEYPENVTAEILIVEDEEAHAEAIQEGLQRQGHSCTVVNDGHTAVSRLAAKQFDIIVTDLMLGDGPDGLAVLAAANEKSPHSRVILVTAHATVDTCRTALQQGAFDYIEKPIDLDDLRAVVARAAEMTAQRRVIKDLRRQLD